VRRNDCIGENPSRKSAHVTVLALGVVLLVPIFGMGSGGNTAPPSQSPTCPDGRVAQGDLGISEFECHCSVTIGDETVWRFRTEPEIRALREDGPAEGVLQAGDRIVAIDGHLVTTEAGGDRWSHIRPGERLELRVRRDHEVKSVEIVAEHRCSTASGPDSDPRKEP